MELNVDERDSIEETKMKLTKKKVDVICHLWMLMTIMLHILKRNSEIKSSFRFGLF